MNPKPKILIIKTGGTISMVRGTDGILSPLNDAVSLRKLVPELEMIAELDVLPLASIDSSNVQPDLWVKLAQAIYSCYDDYDGFVITHGTDTLAFTAVALSLMIQNIGKPVIITGAQVPLSEIGSDGRANLINAVRVASDDLAEVAVVFGTQIIRGGRAKKTSAFHLQAFTSVNDYPIGTIGLTVVFTDAAVRRAPRKPILNVALEPSVAMIPVYPGIKPEILSYLATTHKGIVLEGYGAGNIPTEGTPLIPAIREAVARCVPVVVCTQCLLGSTDMQLYHVGRAALEAGAIPGMDMNEEAALVELMWALGQTRDMKSIESIMLKSYAGELRDIPGGVHA
jgi:L-asparaginase